MTATELELDCAKKAYLTPLPPSAIYPFTDVLLTLDPGESVLLTPQDVRQLRDALKPYDYRTVHDTA